VFGSIKLSKVIGISRCKLVVCAVTSCISFAEQKPSSARISQGVGVLFHLLSDPVVLANSLISVSVEKLTYFDFEVLDSCK
jgi:hypothetical protein